MYKKIIILGIALLTAWQLVSAQEYDMITVSADGTETTYAVASVQKIVFDDGTMTVNMKSGDEITNITCVRFLPLSRIENNDITSNVFVFPNPVKTSLTVSGVDKNVKINIFDMNGKLLQTIISQDKSTDINVSSLQHGSYLLQVGTQTIKFIKQ